MKPIATTLIIGLVCTLLATSCANGGKKTAEDADALHPYAAAIDDLIMSRRSIRAYQDDTLPCELLDEIITLGLNAPNGRNQQAYEIRIVNSPELIRSMTEAVLHDNPAIGERPGFKNIFVGAPCVVFIAADRSYDLSHVDCGLLGENIILAAWARGIGSCCLGAPVRQLKDSPSARPYLNRLRFSEGYELLYCIGLGYPAEQPDAKPRRADKVMYIDCL